jgi:hypothetical protein
LQCGENQYIKGQVILVCNAAIFQRVGRCFIPTADKIHVFHFFLGSIRKQFSPFGYRLTRPLALSGAVPAKNMCYEVKKESCANMKRSILENTLKRIFEKQVRATFIYHE